VIEWKTGVNEFSHLNRWIPLLQPVGDDLDTFRAGLNRAYASAQHPIAFGAALALVLPIAAAFAFLRRSAIWVGCVALILMGSLASVSRTSFVMVGVAAATLAILRPRAARQALPFVLPLLVAIQIALPGTFSTVRELFLPKGGLVEQQANQSVGSGRVASFGPAIDEAAHHPLLGRGFGTRIVGDVPKRNSFILDDEWLSTTLEIGLVGLIAWVWIFYRFCSRAIREARRNEDERGWLLAALAASIISFAVGMIFFDAFSFIQATFLMVIILGFGAVLIGRSSPMVTGSKRRKRRCWGRRRPGLWVAGPSLLRSLRATRRRADETDPGAVTGSAILVEGPAARSVSLDPDVRGDRDLRPIVDVVIRAGSFVERVASDADVSRVACCRVREVAEPGEEDM